MRASATADFGEPKVLTRQHYSLRKPRSLSMPVTQFVNCWQLLGDKFVREDLWIADGKILDPKLQFWDARMKVCKVCDGFVAVPRARGAYS